jgi:flagellar basal body-associated protein FliL
MKYLNILILSLLKVAQPIRFLQEEAEEEVAETATSSSSSSPMTLIIIIVILVVGAAGTVYYGVTRSKSTKEMNKVILESGESKLRNAFEKIEANGSKDFQSMQVIRGKIVKWEEKQRVK